MEKIARLVHQVSWDIANADARPKSPSHARGDAGGWGLGTGGWLMPAGPALAGR